MLEAMELLIHTNSLHGRSFPDMEADLGTTGPEWKLDQRGGDDAWTKAEERTFTNSH